MKLKIVACPILDLHQWPPCVQRSDLPGRGAWEPLGGTAMELKHDLKAWVRESPRVRATGATGAMDVGACERERSSGRRERTTLEERANVGRRWEKIIEKKKNIKGHYGYFILFVYHEKLFCQIDHQNSFRFTGRAAREARAKIYFTSEGESVPNRTYETIFFSLSFNYNVLSSFLLVSILTDEDRNYLVSWLGVT